MPNLTKILRSIPGGRKSAKQMAKGAATTARGVISNQMRGYDMIPALGSVANVAKRATSGASNVHDKALAWARGKLGYSTESIGDKVPAITKKNYSIYAEKEIANVNANRKKNMGRYINQGQETVNHEFKPGGDGEYGHAHHDGDDKTTTPGIGGHNALNKAGYQKFLS